jgi:hypothetical protein
MTKREKKEFSSLTLCPNPNCPQSHVVCNRCLTPDNTLKKLLHNSLSFICALLLKGFPLFRY